MPADVGGRSHARQHKASRLPGCPPAAYIAAGIALANLLLLADYLIANAVQPDTFDSPARTLIIISLSAILPAAFSFAAVAASYAWTCTIWPHDD